MEKGQITVDLLFAFLAVLVFVTLIGQVVDFQKDLKKTEVIQIQQKAIGENLAKAITNAITLKPVDASGKGTVKIDIPKIYDIQGKEITAPSCTITFSNSQITISTAYSGIPAPIITNVNYLKVGNINLLSTECGKTFEINVTSSS